MIVRSVLIQLVRAVEKRYLADCKPAEFSRNIYVPPTLADGD